MDSRVGASARAVALVSPVQGAMQVKAAPPARAETREQAALSATQVMAALPEQAEKRAPEEPRRSRRSCCC